jgi:hypothetical protein
MAITHTPGPWAYEFGAVYGADEDGISIRLLLADRGEESTSPTERDRNLQLAAAAPEMLEVLSALCAIQESGDVASWAGEWDKARAIIAKATGSAA